jgi:hypothetical protein
MSKKDPFALLQSLGYDTSKLGEEDMKALAGAKGEGLLAKTMQARQLKKETTAQALMANARKSSPGGMGTLGHALSYGAGKRDNFRAEQSGLEQDSILAKTTQAIDMAAQQRQGQQDQNALAGENATLQNQMADRQSREGIERRKAGAKITAAALAASQGGGMNDDQKAKWLEKFGKAMAPEESSGSTTREIAALWAANPDYEGMPSEMQAAITVNAKKAQSAAVDFEKSVYDKTARTDTQRKTLKEQLKDPAQIKADDKIIAKGHDGSIESHKRLFEAQQRVRLRSQPQERTELELASMTNEENNAFSSRRKEDISEYSRKIFGNSSNEISTQYIISAAAQQQMSLRPGLDKQFFNLYSRLQTEEGLRIGGTTLTDVLQEKVAADLGMSPGMGKQGQLDALNNHMAASNRRIDSILGRYDQKQGGPVDRYMGQNESSVLHSRMALMDEGPTIEVPPTNLDIPSQNLIDSRANQEHVSGGQAARGPQDTLPVDPGNLLPSKATLMEKGQDLQDAVPFHQTDREDRGTEWNATQGLRGQPLAGNPMASVLPKSRKGNPQKPPDAMDIFKTPKNEKQANALAQTIAIIQSQSQLGGNQYG